ncbi:toll-like receptor 3 [Astyanax mexicanus]|uniref:Toll-like receptor 3 n=1 Tax=Astyanax mexicanus TaxID=7994 RepID=A0A8T2KRL3_ASTMX|nr:toll-like receptor 3 [Astyanax mexicanus]
MAPPSSCILLLLCLGMLCPHPGDSFPHKTTCTIKEGKADCSHMNLNNVPPGLPPDISTLDMSHNRLKVLDPGALSRYPSLEHLDVSYNSIMGLGPGLCDALPRLQHLSVQRNQVLHLTATELRNCSRLTHLDLSDNRLKLIGEPFSVLKSLTWLDVSRNKLITAGLGTKPQLPSLVTLILSGNDFTTLKTDDFSFLSSSPSFRVLGLSSLPLKQVEHGCFKPVSALTDLVLDGCNLNTLLTKVCDELSDTSVRNLTLRSTLQTVLKNITFKGLLKTNLTMLDLSNNKISKIDDGTFQWLPSLESLSLENNNIKHLTKDTFMGLKSVTQLNLQKALVKTKAAYPIIDDFSFQPLVKLEHLFMRDTSFRNITENMFAGLPSLRTLDLSWSKAGLKTISNTTFASLQGSPLQVLNLTRMALTKLDPGAFSCLGNLTTLVLKYNFISQDLTGEEFRGLNSIREIYLSLNQQKISLTHRSFIHVPTLRVLMLGRALTGTLDMEPSPFRPLTNLTVLDLSNNNIANFNSGLLEGLHHLKVLKMQHNNLARLWKDANPGGPVLFLKDTQNLSVLELDYNGLDEIPLKALRGLFHLNELSLSGNLLNYMHGSIFNDLQALRYLRMEKNLLTSVLMGTFSVPLSNLSELHMEHNPFDCTCESIQWFSDWLNSTNTSVPERTSSYICNTPAAYFNRSVLDFQTNSCKDLLLFQGLYTFSSTMVLGLMAIAFLVHFQGWRIQFFWNIAVNRTLGMKGSRYEQMVEDRYDHDAYVIHAPDDKPWVERSLLPLENENFSFFLEDRDAVPGQSTLESIVENIRRSRKIIFVVTEALLNDPWCRRFKAHHAHHHLVEDNRDSLVLVFLQDVDDYRLSRSLLIRQGMLKSRCIVHWPLQKERIAAFHQKLQIALNSSNRQN